MVSLNAGCVSTHHYNNSARQLVRQDAPYSTFRKDEKWHRLLSSQVEHSVAIKIRQAWNDGCPVAPHSDSDAAVMAAIARRRWNSYERRNASIPDTFENRIKDLARGLAEKYTTGGWAMVGPLITDYQWLSEQIAPILAETD